VSDLAAGAGRAAPPPPAGNWTDAQVYHDGTFDPEGGLLYHCVGNARWIAGAGNYAPAIRAYRVAR
jgi:hypothetical protein